MPLKAWPGTQAPHWNVWHAETLWVSVRYRASIDHIQNPRQMGGFARGQEACRVQGWTGLQSWPATPKTLHLRAQRGDFDLLFPNTEIPFHVRWLQSSWRKPCSLHVVHTGYPMIYVIQKLLWQPWHVSFFIIMSGLVLTMHLWCHWRFSYDISDCYVDIPPD